MVASLLSQFVYVRFADSLRQVAHEHTGVSIGSYPNVAECTDAQSFRVRLQLESRSTEALEAAVAAVRAAVECTPPSAG